MFALTRAKHGAEALQLLKDNFGDDWVNQQLGTTTLEPPPVLGYNSDEALLMTPESAGPSVSRMDGTHLGKTLRGAAAIAGLPGGAHAFVGSLEKGKTFEQAEAGAHLVTGITLAASGRTPVTRSGPIAMPFRPPHLPASFSLRGQSGVSTGPNRAPRQAPKRSEPQEVALDTALRRVQGRIVAGGPADTNRSHCGEQCWPLRSGPKGLFNNASNATDINKAQPEDPVR